MKTLFTALLFSSIAFSPLGLRAESVDTAPEELTDTIFEIEDAANDGDLDGVLDGYSDDFTNTDGLTIDSLAQGLEQMWLNFPELTYTTEITSWSEEDGLLVAETITTIQGVQKDSNRVTNLNSTIKSLQYFEDSKIVNQKILAEQSKLTSGNNPPRIKIVAPETVKIGEKYNFDVIVDRPLEDRVLLGAIKEEKTASNLYLNPTALELEPLPAGGIFKTATAPLLPDSNWISAILVRGDGITTIVHRVNIEEEPAKNKK